jgi:hypothetical protein
MPEFRLFFLIVTLFLSACAHPGLQVNRGPAGDVGLIQNGKAVMPEADGTLVLHAEPFEIHSRWSRVNVCLTRSAAELGRVAAGVDTVREPATCFNLGKAYAMEANADYLVVGEGFNALNDTHGMKQGNGYFGFPVRFFYDERSRADLPLSRAAGLYHAAFWVDKSGDRRLDPGEYTLVRLRISPRTP